MITKYGSYTHDQNSVGIRWQSEWMFDGFKRRCGEKLRLTLIGVLRSASQSELTTKIQALQQGYSQDYQDFTVFLDDGTTPTAHRVLNADSFGGVKVVSGPSFINGPWSGRPEYANQRTFYIVIQAERRYGTGLYSWKERLVIRGTGAPKWRYSPQIVGDAQKQTLQTSTTFHYRQEGVAVGHDDYPVPPGPLFPTIEHGDERVITFETPDLIVYGSQPRMPKTGWQYNMEATVTQGFTGFLLPTINPITP